MGNEVTVDLSNVFTDADNDTLTITADKGIVTGTMWSYTPVAGDAGTTISVTLTADDGKGGMVQDTFTVTVKVESSEPLVTLGAASNSLSLIVDFSETVYMQVVSLTVTPVPTPEPGYYNQYTFQLISPAILGSFIEFTVQRNDSSYETYRATFNMFTGEWTLSTVS